MEFFYVYVLRSLKDNKFYTGYTINFENRIKLHNEGKVPSTKSRLPLEIIYYEVCLNQEDALHREKYLPRGIKSQILMQNIIPQGKRQHTAKDIFIIG